MCNDNHDADRAIKARHREQDLEEAQQRRRIDGHGRPNIQAGAEAMDDIEEPELMRDEQLAPAAWWEGAWRSIEKYMHASQDHAGRLFDLQSRRMDAIEKRL